MTGFRTTPRHVAIILDGNRRWARRNGLDAVREGHAAGFGKIPEVLGWCEEAGIGTVTLWMLSDDNIRSRTPSELADLYDINRDVVSRIAAARRWQLRHIGDPSLLPETLAEVLLQAEKDNRHVDGLRVNLALAYGGRADVVNAVRTLFEEMRGIPPQITEESLSRHMSTAGQPDPDLAIRPSGELRTSGLLLWQAALSELYFCDCLWPDFSRADFDRALRTYGLRDRRLGA
ncbi:polyprenyl diphosphate synthase [Streptomyces sp. NPDC059002]|uniref:polyprenyl diphosphate synthase n=1 Tax=Streptomyces sp. NPDC059002 TaxID=3346690 RepID=UPI0036B5C95E